jgi:hypothetical protein
MSRRKKRDTWDDILDLLMITPIWFGPILAAMAYVLFAYVAPRFFPVKPPGEIDPGVALRPMLPALGGILAAGILFLWIVACFAKLARRARSGANSRGRASETTPLRSREGAGARGRATSSAQKPSALAPTPPCPACGSPTVVRTAKHGPNAGSTFYGCSRYPQCKGIVKTPTIV